MSNIFASIRLSLFSENEAHHLLATLAAGSGLTFLPRRSTYSSNWLVLIPSFCFRPA